MKTVKTKMDNLEAFLYVLMRDHLPSGEVEQIMEKHVEKAGLDGAKIRYTNNYLYEHAKDLATRLKDKQ